MISRIIHHRWCTKAHVHTNTQVHRKPLCASTSTDSFRRPVTEDMHFTELCVQSLHAHSNKTTLQSLYMHTKIELAFIQKYQMLLASTSAVTTHLQIHMHAHGGLCEWGVFWHRVSEIAFHAQRHTASHKAVCLLDFKMSLSSLLPKGYQQKLYLSCSGDLLVWSSWWVTLFFIMYMLRHGTNSCVTNATVRTNALLWCYDEFYQFNEAAQQIPQRSEAYLFL